MSRLLAGIVLTTVLGAVGSGAAPASAGDAGIRVIVRQAAAEFAVIIEDAGQVQETAGLAAIGTRLINAATRVKKRIARARASTARGRRGRLKAIRGFGQIAKGGRDLRAAVRAGDTPRGDALVGKATAHMARGQRLLEAAKRLLAPA